MNLISFFSKRSSAPVARERLQILLAHERSLVGGQPDLVNILREEILAVVAKHVNVEGDKVQVKMERGDSVSMLEIDVEIPTNTVANIRIRA
jgi:cell division topological specificity factor